MKMLTLFLLMVLGIVLTSLNTLAIFEVLINDTFSDGIINSSYWSSKNWTEAGGTICTDGKLGEFLMLNYSFGDNNITNITKNTANFTLQWDWNITSGGGIDSFATFDITTSGKLFQFESQSGGGVQGVAYKNYIANSDSIRIFNQTSVTNSHLYPIRVIFVYNGTDTLQNSTVIIEGNRTKKIDEALNIWELSSFGFRTSAVTAYVDNFLYINGTFPNVIPFANNVSITPLPLPSSANTTGHAQYNDEDRGIAGGNQTYWYVNRTIITEANNSFTLLSGNITQLSNITFSIRFNDTFDWGDWVNSTTITAGDTTAPILNNCTLSSTSITDASGNTINLTCEATDASSDIQTMVASLNGTINKTLSFSFTQAQTIKSSYIIFSSLETLLVGSYSTSQVNVTDTSTNKLSNATNDLHFQVTSAPSGGSTPSGGGGGSSTTIISLLNGTPLLSFGIIELNFFVVTTPTESQKMIKFINIGNVSFTSGKIEIQGSIEPYIKASVCDLNASNCKIRDIELKSGQNAFLVVDGNFTQDIESGVAGIIRLNGNKVFDLAVVADRPPLYNKAVLPFVRQGFSEPLAYIIGYSLTSLIVLGSLFFIKGVAA